jgi:hypothetical protein
MPSISVLTYNYHPTLFRRLAGYFTRLIQLLSAGDRVFYSGYLELQRDSNITGHASTPRTMPQHLGPCPNIPGHVSTSLAIPRHSNIYDILDRVLECRECNEGGPLLILPLPSFISSSHPQPFSTVITCIFRLHPESNFILLYRSTTSLRLIQRSF